MGTVHKFTLVDRLRENSKAHKSIVKTLISGLRGQLKGNLRSEDRIDLITGLSDDIFEELWLDGFKIVPRDDGGRAA